MPRIDAFDEAVIDSPPLIVFKAILDEYAGITHWRMPLVESKIREGTPHGREGAIYDATRHTRGTPKGSLRITKIVEGKLIEVEEEGDFVGTGIWTFEPTNGKTKIGYRWSGRPKRLSFRLLSPFIDIRRMHSDGMQKIFIALNSYLSKEQVYFYSALNPANVLRQATLVG
jgi:hypothetical protein